MAQPISQEI